MTRGPAARTTDDLFPALRLRRARHRARPLAVFGVPLTVDVSWLFGFGLATWTFADAVLPTEAPGRTVSAYIAAGALTAVLLLGSIVLHEAGHWIAARRAGLPVSRVGLSLVGGSLELGAAPPTAATELWLALGGPVASLVTAALALGVHVVLVEAATDPLLASVPAFVAVGSLAVGLLNLLPGLPLDGGRVLRAAVWAISGDEEAGTRIARQAGRILGAGLLVVAVVASASGDAAAALWAAVLGLTIHRAA